MELRRATYGAAVRLAFVLSVVAAATALTLDAIGDVSATRLAAIVAVVGFTISWVQTGRVSKAVESRGISRVGVVALHQPVG